LPPLNFKRKILKYIVAKFHGDTFIAFEKSDRTQESLRRLYLLFSDIVRIFHVPNAEDEDDAVLIATLLDKAVIDISKDQTFYDTDKSEITIRLKLNGERWSEFKEKTINASMGEYLRVRLGKNKGNISAFARDAHINRKTAQRLINKYKENLN